ncbi:protein containing Mandelate racemase/muconate lactonizing enzyme, partial [human gut metagenome]
YKAQGFRMMKMKVGGAQPGEDMERVAAVREVLGTDVKLAVDANNSWDYETALKMARFLKLRTYIFWRNLSRPIFGKRAQS